MFKAFVTVLVAGCATTNLPDHNTTVSIIGSDEAGRIAPLPIDPTLPSVDRIADRVRYTLGASAMTELELCVRPSGKVASVELVGASALPAFDLAVVDDASAWKFTSLPGPEKLETCELADVAYRASR
jgi:hypothetical protein